MKRILRIGMDVRSTNYTLCAIEPRFDGDDIIYANIKVTPEPDNIVQFIENIKKKVKDECGILCGYEAGCLAYGGYHAVHIPTDKDDDVKVYLRMRDDHKQDLKKTKQRISAFCLSQGYHYDGGKWTQVHFKWLKALELSGLDRETLGEYLITYEYQTNRIES